MKSLSDIITISQMRRYLIRNNWVEVDSNRPGLSIFLEHRGNNPIEIILPKSNYSECESNNNLMDYAVEAIAFSKNITQSEIVQELRCLDKDLHNYKINTDSGSVSVDLIYSLLRASKHMLSSASKIEHKDYYYKVSPQKREHILNPTDRSNEFLNECKFAHTWKGSFGITIEVPLGINNDVLFDNIPISDTALGRRTTSRIVKGNEIINKSLNIKSANYIIDNIKEPDDISFYEKILDIDNVLHDNSIDMNIILSKTIFFPNNLLEYTQLKINHESINIISTALDSLKIDNTERDIEFVGFPETISATREHLLECGEGADMKVTVRGISKETDNASLRLELDYDDYKKALKAHEEAKYVKIKCKVKKKIRGWDVLNISSFEIL